MRMSRALLTVSAVVLVTAVAGGLLFGSLARPGCGTVDMASVRAAVAGVDGYTYQISGSQTVGVFRPAASPDSYPATIEASGAYRAQGAWSLLVTEGYRPSRAAQPDLGVYIQPEWDAFLVSDGAPFVRPRGSEQYEPAELSSQPGVGELGDIMLGTNPNRLLALLDGQPWHVSIPGQNEVVILPLEWAPQPAEGGCGLTATRPDIVDPAEGSEWQLDIVVDPTTQLPGTVLYHYRIPVVPIREQTLTFTFNYGGVPEISAPDLT